MTEENIRLIEEELLSGRRLMLKEISARLEIPKTTIIRIIHEHLHMKKVSASWVPRLLSSIQKEHHLTCFQKILELCRGNQKQVLESIVTGDETMVLYYDPLSKRETQRSTAEKGQGHLVHQEDQGNDHLGVQRNFDWLISKKETSLWTQSIMLHPCTNWAMLSRRRGKTCSAVELVCSTTTLLSTRWLLPRLQ